MIHRGARASYTVLPVLATLVLAGACVAADSMPAAAYARAAEFMPAVTMPLVYGTPEDITWLPDGSLRYRKSTAGGTAFERADPGRGTLHPIAAPAAPAATAATAAPSPDGRYLAFIRDDNLWLRDTSDGHERQLTRDGTRDFGYATDNPGWEHSDRPILAWSPDSRRIATFRQDQRGVGDMYLVTTNPGHPHLEAWKYPMAGDAVAATIQRVIIDVASGAVLALRMPPDAHRSAACYDVQCGDGQLADTQWSPDSKRLAFVSTSRDHRRVTLREADAGSGVVRDVLTEESPSYYESDLSSTGPGVVNWRYLPGSGEIIWFSQRSDWAHLYLYDLGTGKLKGAITAGPWNVVRLLHVDARRRELLFVAVGREAGRDPYFAHAYKVGFDGSGLALLTPEDAHHDLSVAPSGDYFVDRYSRPEAPGAAVLRARDGRLVRMLGRTDIGALLATGWRPPVPVTVKARDGVTDLYGLMFRPTRLDAQAHYPVVDYIYPGPHTGSVGSRAFAAARGDAQALAELGFVVIEIDGMGTALRSRHFHEVSYGNLQDNTLPDQVAAIRQLAARYPWIDAGRVGIYGHSGGGYAAARAMFRYPEFFSVGIAESGNHDQRGYTDDWGEKFIGQLASRPDGGTNYDDQDNIALAGNLRGHLLLMHGTLDDNVPPYLTLRLVDALMAANRDFDLLLLPNQRHMYSGEPLAYATRRRWDYFVRYLQGVEPPHEFRLQAGADPAAGQN